MNPRCPKEILTILNKKAVICWNETASEGRSCNPEDPQEGYRKEIGSVYPILSFDRPTDGGKFNRDHRCVSAVSPRIDYEATKK
jgi:hypothetical protein